MKSEIIYFAGLFDGEGSFVLRFKKDRRYVTRYQVTPWINITQKDRRILEKFRKVVKSGKIYYHKRDKLWYLDIFGVDELIKTTKMLLPFLQVKKSKAKQFLKILILMKNKKHLTQEGLKKIKTLWSRN